MKTFGTEIFTVGINSSHTSGLYTPYKKLPQIFYNVARGLITRQIKLTSLSHKQPVTIDY